MTTDKKFKIKAGILVFILTISLSMQLKGQEDFNTSKNWGVSLDYYPSQDNSISAHLIYRYKKSCFFTGYGVRIRQELGLSTDKTEPELYLGYRRYPFKNKKKVKAFMQSFLFYTENDYEAKYITMSLSFGIGAEYDFVKRASFKLSTNYGPSYNFHGKDFSTYLFPFIASLTYKFNYKQF
ncbi:MAG: hypothetical protein U0W24_24035 [Bacteroidales bacterium]